MEIKSAERIRDELLETMLTEGQAADLERAVRELPIRERLDALQIAMVALQRLKERGEPFPADVLPSMTVATWDGALANLMGLAADMGEVLEQERQQS